MELELTDLQLLAAARNALNPQYDGPVALYYLTKSKKFRVITRHQQFDLSVEDMASLYHAAEAPETAHDKPAPPWPGNRAGGSTNKGEKK